jgi:uncharacterized protein YjbI with pentapeptide repeats
MKNKRQASSKHLKAPMLPKQSDTLPLLEGQIEDNAVYTQLHLVEGELTGQRAYHPAFDQVIFDQGEMSAIHFNQARFLDSMFTACNLANGELPESEWTRIELHNCQLTGLQASESKFQDVLFTGCILAFAQFGFASLRNVCFEDCDLSEANFYQADLTGAVFVRCKLQQVDFTETRLLGADLRGSTIDGARLNSLDLLRGAYLDQAQALAIVQGFGINITLAPEDARYER